MNSIVLTDTTGDAFVICGVRLRLNRGYAGFHVAVDLINGTEQIIAGSSSSSTLEPIRNKIAAALRKGLNTEL